VIANHLGDLFEVHLVIFARGTEVQVQNVRERLTPFLVREPFHQTGEGMVAEHGHSILVRLQEKRWRTMTAVPQDKSALSPVYRCGPADQGCFLRPSQALLQRFRQLTCSPH
jgi:hypothetical protein